VVGSKGGETVFRDGSLKEARFFFPNGIVVDRNNYYIVADRDNHLIRLIRWNNNAKDVITLAGRRSVTAYNLVPLELQSIDGLGQKARFSLPTHLSFDNSGQLVVVCVNNNGAVRIVNSLNSSFDAPGHTD
jgi:hypothetical protein